MCGFDRNSIISDKEFDQSRSANGDFKGGSTMTQGQMMFLSGAVLLLLTIVLAIIFIIKKPRYSPEQFEGTDSGATSRFRNGYPTDRLTKRYPSESEMPVQPLVLKEEPKDIQRLRESPKLAEEAEGFRESTEPEEETARLQTPSELEAEKAHPRKMDFSEETEPLKGTSELSENTERLVETADSDEVTEALQETGNLVPPLNSLGEETENLNENN